MTRRPNVVLLMSDDHRGDSIAALGEPVLQTPHLDALIARGACFTRNRHQGGNCGAVCIPTRAAVHSGRGVHHCTTGQFSRGDRDAVSTLAPDAPTLGQTLGSAGYDTFITGKWHNDVASLNRSFADGRAVFLGGMSSHFSVPVRDFADGALDPAQPTRSGAKHSSELFADSAIDFIRSRDRAQPFFLCAAFMSPHDPRESPEPYASMYDPADVPLSASFMPQHPFDLGDLHIRDEELAGHPRTEAEIRRHIADYYGILTHEDAQIGRIVEALRQSGQLEHTIIVYTGDHGLAIGRHGLMGKQNLYEPSVRVPLVMAGPGLPRGLRSEALTQTFDLYPTLCELTGVATPETVEGLSLAPLLDGRAGRVREHAFCAYSMFQRMVTDGRWKLIRYYRAGAEGSDRVQLFDLASDPDELRDLANDAAQRSRLQSLAGALAAWMQSGGDPLADVAILKEGVVR